MRIRFSEELLVIVVLTALGAVALLIGGIR